MQLRSKEPNRRRDDGFTMVILSLTLVVLMIFAAFTVDLGLVYLERRLDQNSVDASATSGAVQFLANGTLQGAVDEITSKASTDLNNRTITAANWTGCVDAARPSGYVTAATLGLTPATNCISFAPTFSRIRVHLPNQTIATAFAKVVGISSFTSTASAEVSFVTLGGGALPFVVLAGETNGQEICLRVDNSGGTEPPDIPPISPYTTDFTLDPCNTNNIAQAQGSRGTLLPYRYANCSLVGNQSEVDAIMVGMDHPLGVFSPLPAVLLPGDDANTLDSNPEARIDGSNSCKTALPNTVAVDTGFTAQLLHCSLLDRPCASGSSATSGKAGRLSVASGTASFTTLALDDNALWSYFGSIPATAPLSCTAAASSATAFYVRRAALADCLAHWTSSVGVLFNENIATEPRLGYVPRVAELGLCRTQPNPPPPAGGCGNGPAPAHAHINNFAPVYLDGLYEDKGGVCDLSNPATPLAGSTQWAIHFPGKGLQCGDNQKVVSRLSGLIVPCGALPADVCDPSSNPPFPTSVGIFRVRLVK